MKNHKTLLILIALGTLQLFNLSCTDTPDEPTTDLRKALIEESWTGYLSPKLKKLEAESITLHEKVEDYCNNPTPDKLKVAQEAWLNTYIALKQQEVFTFGPYRLPYLTERRKQLDNWPTSSYAIKKYIKDGKKFTPDYFTNTNKTVLVGLPAIEYLLFALSPPPSQNDNSCKYLLGATGAVTLVSQDLYKAWNPEEPDGYFRTMIHPRLKKGKPDYLIPLSEIVNTMWHTIIDIRLVNLGKPVGLKTPNGGTSGGRSPAYYSGKGVLACKQNLLGVKELYLGSPNAKVTFAKVIKELNPALHEAIMDNFAKSEAALDKIHDPLQKAVEDQKQDVLNAIETLLPLQTLFSTNVLQELGLVYYKNESDND